MGRADKSLFEFDDYKAFTHSWVQNQPRGGYGQFSRMARHISVHPVVISQVFNGDRHLVPEQAAGLIDFFRFGDTESDFYLLLVDYARSGSDKLSQILKSKILKLRKEALKIKTQFKHEDLSSEVKAEFYSSWAYSAMRLASVIPKKSAGEIGEALGISKHEAENIVQFLLAHNLLIREGAKLKLGSQVIHVGEDSPFVNRHHNNWRLRGLQAMDKKSDQNTFYTAPMVIDSSAREEIRPLILKLIKDVTRIAVDAKETELCCLNIDWFRQL